MESVSKGDEKTNHKNGENSKLKAENEQKGKNENVDKDSSKYYSRTDDSIATQNIASLHDADGFENAEEEDVERINGEEAQAIFLLWYNDIQDREKWYKRRIEELESLEDKHKHTIATLKYNDKKLQQRYSRALIEIKVLRKKNLSQPDDQAFIDSYTTLSAERENLIRTSRENNCMIKSLKKEMLLMRSRINLHHSLGQNRTRPMVTSHTKIDQFESQNSMKADKINKWKSVRRTNDINKSNQSEGDLDRSKETYASLDSSTNKQVSKNKREKRNGSKDSELLSLPDIRDRPGHIMWRY